MFWFACGSGLGVYIAATTGYSSVYVIWVVFAAIAIIKFFVLLRTGNETGAGTTIIFTVLFFFAVFSGSKQRNVPSMQHIKSCRNLRDR